MPADTLTTALACRIYDALDASATEHIANPQAARDAAAIRARCEEAASGSAEPCPGFERDACVAVIRAMIEGAGALGKSTTPENQPLPAGDEMLTAWEREIKRRVERIRRHEDPSDRHAERIAMHPECAEYPVDVSALLSSLAAARQRQLTLKAAYREVENERDTERARAEALAGQVEMLRSALQATRIAYFYTRKGQGWADVESMPVIQQAAAALAASSDGTGGKVGTGDVISIWLDGSWKRWREKDALHAQDCDADYLTTIWLREIAAVDALDAGKGEAG